MPEFLAECYCGRGDYDPTIYSSCYKCFQDRMADLTSCIFCGTKHSVDFPTCFKCRQITGRDEAGKALRLDILIRDEFTCQDCGSNEALQVDHIKPCAARGLASPWNLQVLCRDCNKDKGADWWFGSEWDAKRIQLMHLYLTFGWSLLDEDQQEDLIIDTADYADFDSRIRVLLYNDELPALPQWALDMADEEEETA